MAHHHASGRLKARFLVKKHHFWIAEQVDGIEVLQAVHHLHKAKKLVDPNYLAVLELGRVHHDRRQYEMALEQIDKAISIAPEESEGYYQAGRVLKDLKKFDQAERMLRRASKLAPNDLKIHRQLGVLVTLNLVHGDSRKEVKV